MSNEIKNTYGIMLIGCGHIGEEHIADIYFRDNIRIVAVIDTDIERARLFGRKYGAEISAADYREYLDRRDIDIVIIATNVDTHLEILKDCIAAHKHVLCEKPMAICESDFEEFYRLASQAEVSVAVAHILRFNRTYRRVGELISQGAIGELQVARMVQNHHCKDWPRYRRLLQDCSPILDCGVHYFDLLQWYTGSPIVAVGGIGTRVGEDLDGDIYNYGIANLQLQNGVIGYYEAGWGETFSSCNVKEFIGTEGRISLTLNRFRHSHTEEGDLIEVYTKAGNCYRTVNSDSLYKPMWEQLKGLIDRIEGRPSASPSLQDCYSSFCVALAADRAIRENSYVAVQADVF